MDSAKRDEHMSEHAANLLGTGQQSKRTQSATKTKSRYLKILCAVLLLALLALILTIIFILKLRCSDKVTDSCRNRCLSERHDSNAVCHCDSACENEGTCCLDYKEVCVEPSQRWTCSKFRCGEERLLNSLCSCSEDCVKKGDCCFNYKHTCEGEKPWLEEDCEDIRTPQCPAGFSKPPLLLVSLDGFRAGYMKAYSTLLPGLYPESHGIVDNKMYDVTRNASFSLRVDEKFNPAWYLGEPLCAVLTLSVDSGTVFAVLSFSDLPSLFILVVWLTAMKNKLKTATFFWPGSDVEVSGQYPDYWVLEALLNVDKLIGLLMEGLKQRKLHKCVNLILVSDHGMEEASCKKAVFISNYLDNIDDITVIQGPAARVRPKHLPDEFFSFDYEGLVKNLSCREPDQPMRPYLKEHLPKRLHFAKTNQAKLNTALADSMVQIMSSRTCRLHYPLNPEKIFFKSVMDTSKHFYLHFLLEALFKCFHAVAIFIGHGPGILSKTTVVPFENIEVYNLLCDLLGIPPAPNNGTHGSLNHLLKNPPHQPVFPAERSAPSTCTPVGGSSQDPHGCTCDSLTQAEVNRLNQRLIDSNSQNFNVKPVHLPYGIPRVLQEQSDYCILHHREYVRIQPSGDKCVRADVRVQASARQSCSFYKNNSTLTFGLLHPPNFSPTGSEPDSLITSNMVPMFPAFKDIWNRFHDVLLVKYSQELNGVNVVSGPIFDSDFDGNYDFMNKGTPNRAPIPTHFFVILTSCGNSSLPVRQCDGPLDAVSYVLPHRPDNLEMCHATNSTFRMERIFFFTFETHS
ncbi:Ectonucleotide pyrophosphatase/phosphodiesterase family member 1 [Labeo rohita]|uniref:Ectonucleotide pyrophosphatase/phosphodiesterase family member 1 n=1 Tax=Labeo rohita TaxID=84645 RepID=A0ABQ8LP94_LABRO|nr:Ectonucleotide pyrophosphatase/phosphodiesterase family member 1 [Labeo rohita]